MNLNLGLAGVRLMPDDPDRGANGLFARAWALCHARVCVRGRERMLSARWIFCSTLSRHTVDGKNEYPPERALKYGGVLFGGCRI